MDHYLGKRGVRNILEFRLQNKPWEERWNAEHIEGFELVVQENEVLTGLTLTLTLTLTLVLTLTLTLIGGRG